jgi:hypothetical protein
METFTRAEDATGPDYRQYELDKHQKVSFTNRASESDFDVDIEAKAGSKDQL